MYGTFDCMFLSCHAYAFQSESTLYTYLNVKELLARNRHDIWSPNDCNGTRIHKHLVCKRSNGCGFTLSIDFRVWIHSEMRMCDMIRTYSQMHLTDKYLQHSAIIWPVWLNGWVFLYKLVGCGFNPRYIYLNVRYRACFEQGVFWHSGNYRVWIHSEKGTWHHKNIQFKNKKFWFYICCCCCCCCFVIFLGGLLFHARCPFKSLTCLRKHTCSCR